MGLFRSSPARLFLSLLDSYRLFFYPAGTIALSTAVVVSLVCGLRFQHFSRLYGYGQTEDKLSKIRPDGVQAGAYLNKRTIYFLWYEIHDQRIEVGQRRRGSRSVFSNLW